MKTWPHPKIYTPDHQDGRGYISGAKMKKHLCWDLELPARTRKATHRSEGLGLILCMIPQAEPGCLGPPAPPHLPLGSGTNPNGQALAGGP